MPPLSAAASLEIRDSIDGALRTVRASSAAFAGPPLPVPPEKGELRREFCALWPAARPVLATLAALLGLVPGIGAGPVLGALVAVADQTYEGVCRPRA